MVLVVSRVSQGLTSHPCIKNLSPASSDLLRTLLFVVPAPVGMPNIKRVLKSMNESMCSFGSQLSQPTEIFIEISQGLAQIASECGALSTCELDLPLRLRRLSEFPAWRLFSRDDGEFSSDQHQVAGAELALAILEKRPFRKELARMMHGDFSGQLQEMQYGAIRKKSTRVVAEALRLFEMGNAVVEVEGASFEERLRDRTRATLFFGRDRQHQAIADHRASSASQVVEAAKTLRDQVEAGSAEALFVTIAALANLPAELAVGMPLLRTVQHDWVMVLDAEIGCIKVCIDLYSPGRARSERRHSGASLESGDVVVVPLPEFVAEALEACVNDRPTARTLGELLETETPDRQRLLTQSRSGIAGTFARFRNGLGPFVIQIGMSRYVAAMLLSNPLLVPTGKFFYSRIEPVEISKAAEQLYAGLGWGKPASVTTSLAAGSRQIASDETIIALGCWLKQQLETCPETRRYSLDGLVKRHNVMALVCASLTILQLALRARKVIPVSQGMARNHGLTVSIFDKRVGEFPGTRPIPLSTLQRRVFEVWMGHLDRLDARLVKLDTQKSLRLAKVIQACRANERPAFFEIDTRHRAISIGSARVHNWWPAKFGLAPNFGRHFWQDRLRREGVADTAIDAFVRHSVSGMDPHTSTSHVVLADWARTLIEAIDRVNHELGLDAIYCSSREVL